MDKEALISRFDEIYNTKIVPEINILEENRIKTKEKFDNINKLEMKFVILMLLSFFSAVINPKIATIFFCIFFIPFGILIYKQDRLQKEFIKYTKSHLFIKILKVFGDFRLYDSELIKLNEIKKSGFFPNASSKNDDDKFAGKYQSLDTFIVETKLSHSGSRGSSCTDFSGLVVRTCLNKTYTGKTVLFQKTLSATNLNQVMQNCAKEIDSKEMQELSKTITNSKLYNVALNLASSKLSESNSDRFQPPRNLKEVKLEDEEFNKIYSVYSNDQVEARYVITTAFMERLKNVREIFNADFVHCTFEDKFVTFYISTYKNFFEICDINKSLYDNYNTFRDVFCELYSIFNLLYYFKLDKKTGL